LSETDEDVLVRICIATKKETARRKAAVSEEAMLTRAIAASAGGSAGGSAGADVPRGFAAALEKAAQPALIAEIKKASPSGGMIREPFVPAFLAAEYAAGGATCLSVLTDGPFFQGSLEDFGLARAAVDLPVLRKDFILDPWQIYESRAHGADCILLIVAALHDEVMEELESIAIMLGMDVLAEVHTAHELSRALKLKTKLIGINNRNLKTLKTDLAVTRELAKHVPSDRIIVAESGIREHDDILALTGFGARAFLVGESLLRQPDLIAATKRLRGTA